MSRDGGGVGPSKEVQGRQSGKRDSEEAKKGEYLKKKEWATVLNAAEK